MHLPYRLPLHALMPCIVMNQFALYGNKSCIN
jgi:hypothetical protein